MAWKGKVASKTSDQGSGTLTLDIDFYDDTNPAVMLVRRQIPVPAGATPTEIRQLVKDAGVKERSKANDLKTLDAKISVGDEVVI